MKEVILLLFCVVAVYGLGDKCGNCLPKRLFVVYERRGCEPVMSPECGCPLYHECPAEAVAQPLLLAEPEKLKLKLLGENACIFKNKVYAINEELPIPCQVCSCRQTETARNVSGYMLKGEAYGDDCGHDDCFNDRLPSGCHNAYRLDYTCCPRIKICAGHEKVAVKCKLGERTYGFGEHIHPKNEPCKTCYCDEKFDENNLEKSTCWELDCDFGQTINKEVFIQHCTPVYFSNNNCCYHDVICAENFDPYAASFEARPTNLTDTCVLRGKSYKMGEKMNFKWEDLYRAGFRWPGECTCQVPPLMTCFLKSPYKD